MDLSGLDPKIIAIILAVNIVLSAATGLLDLFAKPESKAGKVALWIGKVVKFISANVKSK